MNPRSHHAHLPKMGHKSPTSVFSGQCWCVVFFTKTCPSFLHLRPSLRLRSPAQQHRDGPRCPSAWRVLEEESAFRPDGGSKEEGKLAKVAYTHPYPLSTKDLS